MSVFESVSFALASLGAVLGVISTVYLVRQNHVRLRVTPSHGILASGPPCLTIEAVNLSSFPVTLTSIGLRLRDGKQVINPNAPTIQGLHLPVRLEPRAAVTAMYAPSELELEVLRMVECAFARTACGIEKCGSSPALRQIVENGPLHG